MTQLPTPVRVLVVDDDPMSRELLCLLLQREGYAAQPADSGESALALLNHTDAPPDLVLADLQMPGITGAALAEGLRRACGPAALIVAMSGSQPERQATLQFDGFLLKPFKIQQVAEHLAAHTHASLATVSPTTSNPPAVPHITSTKGMASCISEARSTITTSATGSPVLNETIYQQLAGAMPATQLHEMYAMCVADIRERIALMCRLMTSHDEALFVREAHAIKGSTGMLGATQLHGLAAELERSGLDSSAWSHVNSLDELSAACDRLERMLGSRA